jgi:CheY-like chemotaxis protein
MRINMDKTKLLVVDNRQDYLETIKEYLEKEGYYVVTAENTGGARDILAREDIDLVILDIRLEDDEDDRDFSGLSLAKNIKESIPKIILTGFPSVEGVRDAFKPRSSGLPTAVDFVSKLDGAAMLVAAVNRAVAVHVKKQPKKVIFNLSEQLEKDYEESRKQATITHRVRLGLVIIGWVVIIIGAIVVLFGYSTAGILNAIAGILAQVLAAFFSKLSEAANIRMDEYHKELLKLYTEQYDS